MAKPGSAAPSPWIKSDEIRVDTSQAQWMAIAYAELNKKVRELAADDAMLDALRFALARDTLERQIAESSAKLAESSKLFGSKTGAMETSRYRLFTKELGDPASRALGSMEASRLRERNPEISKYFNDVKTDPSYDKKGRSFAIDSTYSSGDRGQITAWCAAFVNWCLRSAGAPRLGYATAKSWLDFGTPIAHPVYGCITVIKPSSSTGSTTGHVAFFVERQGSNVKLLGGNQVNGTRVSESLFAEKTVLGYRWPTTINHYLLARTGVLA